MRHVVHILEATTGGTRRHLWDIVNGLNPSRFRQSVIASPLRDPGFLDDAAAMRKLGVDVHLVPMRRSPVPWADATAAARVVRLLRELRPDVVHTHSSKAGMLGRWAAHRVGVPCLVHTPHVFAFEMRMLKPLALLIVALERMAARWTDVLVCVSEAEARSARRLGRAAPRVRVIRNGVPDPAGEAPALPLSEPLRVTLVGRLCVQKGQDTLARMLLSHPALARRCTVDLVGIRPGAPLPAAVRTAAASGLCHLRPPLDPSAVPAYLETVDVVVMPSRWEGLPYTLLEAMAAGRCVVASAVGGVPEVVQDGVNGRLVPPDDPAALGTALLALLDDPGASRRGAIAARETVAREFRLDRMLEGLASVYEEGKR